MTCEELSQIYDSYALGCTEGSEQQELREHLARACPTCVPGVRSGIELASRFSSLAKVVEPPARLRKRVLALVNPALLEKSEKPGFGWGLLFAGLAILFMVSTAFLGLQTQRITESRRLANERLTSALAVLSAPDSVEVNFGNAQPKPPRGKVFINKQKGVLLLASNLPKLEPGKIFELWVIPKGGKPLPSVLFTADASGSGLAYQSGIIDTAALGAIAVTVEDEKGVQAPTTPPIIVAPTAGV